MEIPALCAVTRRHAGDKAQPVVLKPLVPAARRVAAHHLAVIIVMALPLYARRVCGPCQVAAFIILKLPAAPFRVCRFFQVQTLPGSRVLAVVRGNFADNMTRLIVFKTGCPAAGGGDTNSAVIS